VASRVIIGLRRSHQLFLVYGFVVWYTSARMTKTRPARTLQTRGHCIVINNIRRVVIAEFTGPKSPRTRNVAAPEHCGVSGATATAQSAADTPRESACGNRSNNEHCQK